MAAEVDDRGLQLHEMTRHVVNTHGPPRAEFEVLAIRRHAELALDRGAFAIERKLTGTIGIGRKEQDEIPSAARSPGAPTRAPDPRRR